MRALERGAPLDLAVPVGRRAPRPANRAFGIDLALLDEADAADPRARPPAHGPTRWYFETGQGSELSSGAHAGRRPGDARGALLRRRAPLPAAAREHRRRLHRARVPLRRAPDRSAPDSRTTSWASCSASRWACDVCYTNHAEADQNDLESLAVLLAAAGCNYFMGVPMGDDCMLGYQTSSFHDVAGAARAARPAARAGVRGVARGARADGRRAAHRARGRPARVARVSADDFERAPPRDAGAARRRAAPGTRPRDGRVRSPSAPITPRARDAVLERVERRRSSSACARSASCCVASAAPDRLAYIREPPLGRRLAAGDAGARPRAASPRGAVDPDRASPTASRHAPPRRTSSALARARARPRARSARSARRSRCATAASRWPTRIGAAVGRAPRRAPDRRATRASPPPTASAATSRCRPGPPTHRRRPQVHLEHPPCRARSRGGRRDDRRPLPAHPRARIVGHRPRALR